MANKPPCPDNYEWLPTFGRSSSCFKISPTLVDSKVSDNSWYGTSVAMAEHHCTSDFTRLAVPADVASMSELKKWYRSKDSSQVQILDNNYVHMLTNLILGGEIFIYWSLQNGTVWRGYVSLLQ